MTEETLHGILNSGKLYKDNDERKYIGNNIDYIKYTTSGETTYDEYLVIPNESIIVLMGDEFQIFTIPEFRGRGNAKKLVDKYRYFMEDKCGEKDDSGYIPYVSCTTTNNTMIRILKSLGWKYTGTRYTKPHGGTSGTTDKKWRYFYE